ncbi:hypothetical protein [Nocardia sp. MH4]|uniref:hypothetical protein n=1 Tax=Nocardia sp. MH4 TaxID=1768677 RepID=UPI001C4E583F|nr:hypothetical protein [Nocardia sp. MH4]
MSSRTRTSILTTLVAVATALLLAGPATAQVPAVVTFSPGNQSAVEKKHGTWTGDVVYASEAGFSNRLFWTLVLAPEVQAIITGNTMSCAASVDGMPNYHDRHDSVPADYKWHSTVKDLALDTPYTWRAHCAFGTTEGPGEVKFAVSFVMKS